jgi:hypothetical protein
MTTWYHGTVASLEPDDLITPGREANFDQSHSRRVYFTPVLGWAVFYACTVAAPNLVPHVYEVRPIAGRVFRDPNSQFWGDVRDRQARWSSQPLIVVREIPLTPELLRRASRLMSRMEASVRRMELEAAK